MHTADPAQREPGDVDVRAVLIFAAGLLAAGIIIHFLIWLLFLFFAGQNAARTAPQFPLAAGREMRLPPEPRLQANPRQDLRELRAAEDATLNTYGWADKNAGTVRIPIGEAMRLTVQRGLPARQEAKK